jgi:hypothetical protein
MGGGMLTVFGSVAVGIMFLSYWLGSHVPGGMYWYSQ